jgi:LmbE family N-acetylglucosaminyl deacetylase
VNDSTIPPTPASASRHFSRRNVLGGVAAAGGVIGIGVFAGSRGSRSDPPRAKLPPEPVVPPGAAGPPVFVQIVAHADDDIYFMNPDVEHSVRSGAACTTVFLTCGEDDGVNADRKVGQGPHFEEYTTARQNGSRAAYAFMATDDRAAKWQRARHVFRSGNVAELDTLVDAPNVRLLWLNLRKSEGPDFPVPGRLRTLWNGSASSMTTLVPTGSPVGGPYRYDRAGLIAALVEVLEQERPSLVRTQDVDPDYLVHDDRNRATRGHSDYGDHTDHQDHTASALFAWEALKIWKGRGARAHTLVDSYRGYYNERWPDNLAPSVLADKKQIIDVYGWSDNEDYCHDPSGCGDRKVRDRALKSGWPQSTTHRYASGTPWLVRLADGRLTAFAVLDGRVAAWTETAPGGGAWKGPELLDPSAGRMPPHVGVALTADGRPVVAALDVVNDARPDRFRREILVAQAGPGGSFGSWTNLGQPGQNEPDPIRGVGVPVLQADGQGRIHLFVRNFGMGVSTRVRGAGGDWGPWAELGGGVIQEGLSTTVGPTGLVEVFGTRRDGLDHWMQQPDGSVRHEGERAIVRVAGPPTATIAANGDTVVLCREAVTADVLRVTRGPAGTWSDQARRFGGDGGIGAFGMLGGRAGNGRSAIVQRNGLGRVGVVVLDGESEPAEWTWKDLGGPSVGTPAAAVDASDRIVLAVTGFDGRLLTARQQAPGAGAGFDAWQPVG